MKHALIVIFLLLIAIFGSVLTRLNNELIVFNYYFDTIEIPLAFLVTIALIGGALFGALLMVGMVISVRAEKRRLRQRLILREQEVRNLRDIPIKGRH